MGVQGTAANYWYIDTTVNCETPNNCLIHDTSSINRALYISYGDTCDSALYGPVYKKGCDNTTDKRVESPTIDCSGKSSIILEFDYMANKYSYYDYGYVWYSDDNGTSWDSITSRLVSGFCPTYGEHKGYWKHYNILLPSTSNNNPNVKIGFRWKNNDDCVGTFVSIAIDNLKLSSGCADDFYAINDSICPGSCATFIYNSNYDSLTWIFTGASIDTITTINDSTNACYNTPGTYDITLIVFDNDCIDTLLYSSYLFVHSWPSPQGITQNNDTLFANPGATSYQWYYGGSPISGATNYYCVGQMCGNYNVVATDIHGCEVEAVIFDVCIQYIEYGSGTLSLTTCSLPCPRDSFQWYYNGTPTVTTSTYTTSTAGIYYLVVNGVTTNSITLP